MTPTTRTRSLPAAARLLATLAACALAACSDSSSKSVPSGATLTGFYLTRVHTMERESNLVRAKEVVSRVRAGATTPEEPDVRA